MALKKSELYGPLWASCDELRGGKPRKGFYNGCEDIQSTRQSVLYPGEERSRPDTKAEAMPLETLLKSGPEGVAS